MKFRARGRFRTPCGCDVGSGPPPSTVIDGDDRVGQDGSGVPSTSNDEVAATTAPAANPTRPAGDERPTEVTLSAAPMGSHGRIAAVSTPGSPALAHRLNDLGFVPGAMVEVVRRAPLGDPVLYRVSDYEVCLRKAQASAIQVHIAAPAPASAAAAAV